MWGEVGRGEGGVNRVRELECLGGAGRTGGGSEDGGRGEMCRFGPQTLNINTFSHLCLFSDNL